MLWNKQYKNSGVITNSPSFSQKIRDKKILVIAVLIIFLVVITGIYFGSNRYEDRAAEAARKVIPNAKAKQVVVADGFAMAIVYVPKDDTQLGSGNTTVFRVNEDDSMTYIASASYFTPIDLLGFGIPLETQAKLRKLDISNIKSELAKSCGYGERGTDVPGLTGFEGSFNPSGWQIDSASLEAITQTLGDFVYNNNTKEEYDNKVICINTKSDGSDLSVDQSTFDTTFKLRLQFITTNGVVTDHDFTFSDGPVYSRTYTLDGNNISNSDEILEDYTGDGAPPEEREAD